MEVSWKWKKVLDSSLQNFSRTKKWVVLKQKDLKLDNHLSLWLMEQSKSFRLIRMVLWGKTLIRIVKVTLTMRKTLVMNSYKQEIEKGYKLPKKWVSLMKRGLSFRRIWSLKLSERMSSACHYPGMNIQNSLATVMDSLSVKDAKKNLRLDKPLEVIWVEFTQEKVLLTMLKSVEERKGSMNDNC